MVGGVVHGHLAHVLHLRPAAAAGEQGQVVAPDLGVVLVVLQGAGQRVERPLQAQLCTAGDHMQVSGEIWGSPPSLCSDAYQMQGFFPPSPGRCVFKSTTQYHATVHIYIHILFLPLYAQGRYL